MIVYELLRDLADREQKGRATERVSLALTYGSVSGRVSPEDVGEEAVYVRDGSTVTLVLLSSVIGVQYTAD